MARQSQLHFAKWAENLGIDAARHSESIYRNRESRSRRKSGVFNCSRKILFLTLFSIFLNKICQPGGYVGAPPPHPRPADLASQSPEEQLTEASDSWNNMWAKVCNSMCPKFTEFWNKGLKQSSGRHKATCKNVKIAVSQCKLEIKVRKQSNRKSHHQKIKNADHPFWASSGPRFLSKSIAKKIQHQCNFWSKNPIFN